MSIPEVSLILPTQGLRSSLADALRCALAQDFAALEVVVVDDAPYGQPDWQKRPEFAPLLANPRLRVVPFHQSRGCAAAKNAGWQHARGRWICYLDDDNTCAVERVSVQYELATRTGSPVVLCGYTVRAGWRRRQRQVSAESYNGDALLLAASPDTNVLFHRRDLPVRWDEEIGTVDDACIFQAIIQQCRLQSVPNSPLALVEYSAHAGERANLGRERFRTGQRKLLIVWARSYSRAARRVLLLRSLIALLKYRPDGWQQMVATSCRLLQEGGITEWRVVANAVGAKLPLLRRWMVT